MAGFKAGRFFACVVEDGVSSEMEFGLTAEQEELRLQARLFAEEEIRPLAKRLDEDEEFSNYLLNGLWEKGFLGLNIPYTYGGPGLDTLGACLVLEQLAWGCAGVASVVAASALGTYPILLAGSEEQKGRFLNRTNRPMLFSFCLTEPEAGSDAAGLKTSAVWDGDNYVLNGSKCFITNAGYASHYTVFATVDPKLKHEGITAFVVPRGTPGLRTGKKERKMGLRASDTREVILEDVRVPALNRLGREGQGFKLAMETMDLSRPSIGAVAVGLAQAALEAAVDYARERRQFGRPISSFQAVKLMIADMSMQVEAARQLVYLAAYKKEQGLPYTKEAAMAKTYAADTAMKVTTDAVQIFGGYGYTKDFPVEKYMRDAKIMQIFEGTNQIQRLVIAREVFKS